MSDPACDHLTSIEMLSSRILELRSERDDYRAALEGCLSFNNLQDLDRKLSIAREALEKWRGE